MAGQSRRAVGTVCNFYGISTFEGKADPYIKGQCPVVLDIPYLRHGANSDIFFLPTYHPGWDEIGVDWAQADA